MRKRMLLMFCGVLVMPLLCLSVRAEDEPIDDGPKFRMPARESFREIVDDWTYARDAEVPGRKLKVTVSPAELPYPLLKYRFNIYATEMESGNAAPLYSEAHARLDHFRSTVMVDSIYKSNEYAEMMWPKQFDKEPLKGNEEIDELTRLRFKAFPIKSMWVSEVPAEIDAAKEERLYAGTQSVFQLMERGSKKRDCDWGYLIEYKGVATTLEHVQQMRDLARFLAGKANWEIRNGKYDDAVKTIRIGLRLAEHLKTSDYPCIVTSLVGIAIQGIMESEIRLLSAQPDAPNLYPALTQLVERNDIFQKSLQAEQYWLFSRKNVQEIFERMDSATEDEYKMLLDEMLILMFQANREDFEKKFDTTNVRSLACIACYPYGKERLLKQGFSNENIDAMSVYRVVVPYILEEIKAAYDQLIVASSFPVDSKHTAIVFDDSSYLDIAESPARMYLIMLLPAVQAAKNATLRVQQSFDLLKITEAVRYYAAVHDGKLPESLEAMEELYVPTINPVDGKPFVYRVEGNKAIIDFYIHGNGLSRLEIVVE